MISNKIGVMIGYKRKQIKDTDDQIVRLTKFKREKAKEIYVLEQQWKEEKENKILEERMSC